MHSCFVQTKGFDDLIERTKLVLTSDLSEHPFLKLNSISTQDANSHKRSAKW
jgi:hypothetical protein